MRPACLSAENRKVWKSPEEVTVKRSGSQFNGHFHHIRVLMENILPVSTESVLMWEPYSIKNLINLWEYNFLFWWIDKTPKLNFLFSDSQTWIILETGPSASRSPLSFHTPFFDTEWRDWCTKKPSKGIYFCQSTAVNKDTSNGQISAPKCGFNLMWVLENF